MKRLRCRSVALTGALMLLSGLVSCQNNKVVVVDGRTGCPVPGASVYKESGNYRSARHITDGSGSTPTPRLPGFNQWTGVVSKPGYQTVRL